MKNKLNNKGFAVSTVVYAILILLVIFMFTILLLYRNTYRNQKDFNEETKNELNDYLIDEFTPPDINAPSCTLEAKDNLDGSYTLTIKSENKDLDLNGPYMFEGESYSYINQTQKTVNDCPSGICTYKAYVKDMAGNVSNACTATIQFDVTAPTCTLTQSGSGTSRTLTITSSDSDVSQNGYSFDGTNFSSTKTKTVTSAGTYYAYVKDNVGNISNACSTTVVFDTVAPTCSLTTSGSGSSITLTINSSDSDLASSGYSFDGTNFSSTKTKTVTSAGTYYAYVKDNTGNISNACSATVVSHTATFNVSNSCIASPSNGSKISCITKSGGSCSITLPNFTKNTSNILCHLSGTFGWTKTSGGKIQYNGGSSLSLSSNITLYASNNTGSSSGGSTGGSGGSSDDDSDCSIGIRVCSYTNGVCTSCETGDSKGNCIACSCPC